MTRINWTNTPEDSEKIRSIVARFRSAIEDLGRSWGDDDTMQYTMSLTACHLNGTPLDLARLEEADDFNIIHDVSGIHAHVCKITGTLTNCFLPRFAEKTS